MSVSRPLHDLLADGLTVWINRPEGLDCAAHGLKDTLTILISACVCPLTPSFPHCEFALHCCAHCLDVSTHWAYLMNAKCNRLTKWTENYSLLNMLKTESLCFRCSGWCKPPGETWVRSADSARRLRTVCAVNVSQRHCRSFSVALAMTCYVFSYIGVWSPPAPSWVISITAPR